MAILTKDHLSTIIVRLVKSQKRRSKLYTKVYTICCKVHAVVF